MQIVTERSVIDMGQGSYVITLPKVWVHCLGIKPKDKLIVIVNSDLTIRQKKREKTKPVEIKKLW